MAFPWKAVTSGAQAGGMILGPIISNINARNENRWARNWQEDMYEKERADNIAMWQMENEYMEGMWNKQNAYNEKRWHEMNEYNSPAAQMERYKAAGLNPNLAYGSMPQAGPSSAASFGGKAMKGASVGSAGQANMTPIDLSGIGTSIMNIRETSARTNNLEAQNKLYELEAIGKAIDNTIKGTKSESDNVKLGVLKQYSMEMAREMLSQTQTRTSLMEAQRYRTEQSSDIDWKKWETTKEKMDAEILRTKGQTALIEVQAAIKQLEKVLLEEFGIAPNSPWFVKMATRLYDEYLGGIKR